MKSKFLGAFVVGALILGGTACGKSDKKKASTETQSVRVDSDGEWVVNKVEGDDGEGAFVDGRAISIESDENGKRFLVQGALSYPFDDGKFLMPDGNHIEISSYKSDEEGEVMVLKVIQPSCDDEVCNPTQTLTTLNLTRPKAPEVAPAPVAPEATEEELCTEGDC